MRRRRVFCPPGLLVYDGRRQNHHGDGVMPSMAFRDPDGTEYWVEAEEGQTLLQIAHANGIEIEGACDGSMACSTCHVIVDPEWIDLLPEPSLEEEDMLDLALAVTETSRLGCQIVLTADLDGLIVTLPEGTHNALTG